MEEVKQTTVIMTEEQKAKYEAFLKQQEAEEAKARDKKMRQDYKEMTDDAIESMIPQLKNVSEALADHKRRVFEEFSAIIQMKKEMFKMAKGEELYNHSHSFTNSKGTMKIVLGHYVIDNYLDTANVGIAKIQQYLQTLAKDSEAEMLIGMVNQLLAKDAKGTLKASRIIQLRKTAEKYGVPEIIEGVNIIEEAYQPIPSSTFLKAYIRDEATGVWQQIPLGMTEA